MKTRNIDPEVFWVVILVSFVQQLLRKFLKITGQ